jgi:hypothetical protein
VSRLSAGVLRNEPLAGSFFFSCQLVPGGDPGRRAGVLLAGVNSATHSNRRAGTGCVLLLAACLASLHNLACISKQWTERGKSGEPLFCGVWSEDEIRSVEGLRCYARNRFVDAGGAARDGSHCLFGEIRVSLASNQALLSGLSQ